MPGNVRILLGNGDGSFTQPSSSPIQAGMNTSAVAAGNFTSDGFNDLAVANFGSDNLQIFLNQCSHADLAVTIADAPDPIVPGADLTYTIAIQNFRVRTRPRPSP